MKRNKNAASSLELLESRIAPASVLLYTDVDGDQVKIKSSKGDLTGKGTFADIGAGQQLQILDLTDDSFAGAKIKITVKRGSSGDGFANVGFINATGNDLKSVILKGDLGKIVVGDGDSGKPALNLLKVQSIGLLGTSTQGGSYDGGVPEAVAGLLNSLLGTGGVADGLLPAVQDAVGTLLGSSGLEGLTDSVLRVLTGLESDLVTLLDGLVGDELPPGATTLLSRITYALDQLLDFDTGGDIELGTTLGGLVNDTLEVLGELLPALPGLNVIVDTEAGPGDLLGIDLNGLLGGVLGSSLGLDITALLDIELEGGLSLGEVLGDLGDTLGGLLGDSNFGTLPQTLQDLLVDVDSLTEAILNEGALLDLEVVRNLSELSTLLGGLLGANGVVPDLIDPTLTGALSNTLGLVGQILNGGERTPVDPLFNLDSVFAGSVKKIQVRSDIRDASLNVQGSLNNASIRGSLDGGVFEDGGQLLVTGNLGKLTIGRNIFGGELANTGLVDVDGKVGSIVVRGAIVGGEGVQSGGIALASDAKKIFVRKDILGGAGTLSGSIVNTNGEIRSVDIRGSLIAGEGDSSAGIGVNEDIHKLHIRRGITGDADHRVQIAAAGFESQSGNNNFAFQTITIGGSVRHGDILAGYDVSLNPVNGDAGIKSLFVRDNWIASNAVAGVNDSEGLADGFGNASDRVIAGNNSGIVATIAKIQIRGSITGTTEVGDHYGFVAEEIKKMSVNKRKVDLSAGAGSDVEQLSPATADLTVREVTLPS